MARPRNVGSTGDTTKEILSKNPGMLAVTTSTPVEEMLRWDEEGGGLLFDSFEEFVALPPETVGKLGRTNRLRYVQALEIHKNARDDGPGSVEDKIAGSLQVDLQTVLTPTDKLAFEVPKGFDGRWARPEMVRTYEARGWKLARGEAKSSVGADKSDGLHKLGTNGQLELVLLVKPTKLVVETQKQRSIKNERLAGTVDKQGVVDAEARMAGLDEYDESRDGKKRPWKDLATAETVGEE